MMEIILQHIKHAQSQYPALFSQGQAAPWGILFYNPNNTLSIEANHSVLWQSYQNYNDVLAQTSYFYNSKNCLPRLYCYLPSSEESRLLQAVYQFGGTVTKSDLQLLTCRVPVEQSVASPLTFEKLTQWDPALQQFILQENFHLEGTLRGSMEHNSYSLIVGRLFGTPVTMAGLWDSGSVLRISNVMTGEAFRGCGFALALIRHIINLAAQAEKPAYLFANNPVAIRVYLRAGMTLETPDFSLFNWEADSN